MFGMAMLTACGGGTSTPAPDAGVDAGPTVAPPLPPVFTPCPAGWRETTDASGLVTCDPWPATGYRTDCAWDEAHFGGAPGCTRVGTACSADGWPADLPADRVIVYVDDGAAAGGDGASRATAFTTIGAATAAAPSGAIIAVATGLYDEAVSVGAGITLWGACVSGTRIVTSAPSESAAALRLASDGAGARNLGIDGTERPGIMGIGVSTVSLQSVVVTGARTFGLYLEGTSIEASEIVIRGTRERLSDGEFGRAISADVGARLTLSRALLDGNRSVGIFARGAGTSVEASDVVVRGTLPQSSDSTCGIGVRTEDGARVVLSRALIDDNRQGGIFAYGGSTSVEASDVVVRGTREQASNSMFGRGINVEGGAHLTLVRGLIDDSREIGFLVSAAGTVAEASDVVVRGTRERASDATFGRGIYIGSGGHLLLSRAVIDDNRNVGVGVFDPGSSLEANDVVVRGTLPQSSDGTGGNGVWAQGEARVVLAGARVERSRFVGIASLSASSVELRDVVVSGVEASNCLPGTCTGETGGFGLVAIWGGVLAATRFATEDTSLCGVMVGRDALTPTALDLVDGVIDRAAVGACVQQDGYDSTRLQSGVEYRDVGVPLRATSYDLPTELQGQ
jgi:hypothetical protein